MRGLREGYPEKSEIDNLVPGWRGTSYTTPRSFACESALRLVLGRAIGGKRYIASGTSDTLGNTPTKVELQHTPRTKRVKDTGVEKSAIGQEQETSSAREADTNLAYRLPYLQIISTATTTNNIRLANAFVRPWGTKPNRGQPSLPLSQESSRVDPLS